MLKTYSSLTSRSSSTGLEGHGSAACMRPKINDKFSLFMLGTTLGLLAATITLLLIADSSFQTTNVSLTLLGVFVTVGTLLSRDTQWLNKKLSHSRTAFARILIVTGAFPLAPFLLYAVWGYTLNTSSYPVIGTLSLLLLTAPCAAISLIATQLSGLSRRLLASNIIFLCTGLSFGFYLTTLLHLVTDTWGLLLVVAFFFYSTACSLERYLIPPHFHKAALVALACYFLIDGAPLKTLKLSGPWQATTPINVWTSAGKVSMLMDDQTIKFREGHSLRLELPRTGNEQNSVLDIIPVMSSSGPIVLLNEFQGPYPLNKPSAVKQKLTLLTKSNAARKLLESLFKSELQESNVKIEVANSRRFLSRSRDRFSAIVTSISPRDPKSLSAPDFSKTVQSWQKAIKRLNRGGSLYIFFPPGENDKTLVFRAVSLAYQTLRSLEKNYPRQHLLLIESANVAQSEKERILIVTKEPITAEDLFHYEGLVAELDLELGLSPLNENSIEFAWLTTNSTYIQTIRSSRHRLSAPTDWTPYFKLTESSSKILLPWGPLKHHLYLLGVLILVYIWIEITRRSSLRKQTEDEQRSILPTSLTPLDYQAFNIALFSASAGLLLHNYTPSTILSIPEKLAFTSLGVTMAGIILRFNQPVRRFTMLGSSVVVFLTCTSALFFISPMLRISESAPLLIMTWFSSFAFVSAGFFLGLGLVTPILYLRSRNFFLHEILPTSFVAAMFASQVALYGSALAGIKLVSWFAVLIQAATLIYTFRATTPDKRPENNS